MTNRVAALNMVRILLQSAEKNGAHVIATACPLCQVNLECYQEQVNEEFGTDFKMPILYFTQLLGLALGISPKKLGIGIELVSATPVFSKLLPKETN
jgi:heterodisulfide reductase subunit B